MRAVSKLRVSVPPRGAPVRVCRLGLLLVGVGTGLVQAQGLETLVTRAERGSGENLAVPGLTGLSMEQQQSGLRLDSAELLQGLPGVQADSRSNFSQDTRVTLRGFGARSAFGVRGIDLQIDGIPLGTPDGQAQLSSLLPDEVARVEVLRGPLAALHGNGAGGVIRFHSQAPQVNRVTGRTLLGEDGRKRQGITAQGRSGDWSARLQAARFESEGERPHAEAEREQAGLQVYRESDSGLELQLRLDFSRDPLVQDPLGLTPEQWRAEPQAGNERALLFDTRKKLRHRQGSLSLRQNQGENRWQLALWRGDREVGQWLAFAGDAITSSGAVIDLDRDFWGLRGSYTRELALGNTRADWTLGLAAEAMDDRRRGFVNDLGKTGALRRNELGQVDSRDAYTIFDWQPHSHWRLIAGARRSEVDFELTDYFIVPAEGNTPANPDDSGLVTQDFWSRALSVQYHWKARWQVHASLGRGFETPTLAELNFRNEGSGLNLALGPARNDQRELGLSYDPDQGPSLALTLFQVDSRDELLVDQSQGGRTTFRNASETRRWGLEASGEWPISPHWWARYSASYLDAEFSSSALDGNRLPGIADTNFYAQLRWLPWRDERLALGLVARHRSDVATGDDNQTFAPSATTWDLSLDTEHDWAPWTLEAWLKLENLTDKTHVGSVIVNQSSGRAFEPAPGRRLSAGLTLNYQW